ncbi:hypothetical protein [uncultured Dokdonia sp.]|uniref:hypothetical protein n=1 Tax=uncultured Dokdonia sp. TaxID=575653 RepID=UPI00261C9B34|nr:hypothetical protein [uncultured Dokdonia sp.]
MIESNTNTLQTTEVTHKFGAFIEPKIDVNLSPSLKISGSWKGIIFREKDIDDTFLQLYYFKVGIAYHISKRAWDFTN